MKRLPSFRIAKLTLRPDDILIVKTEVVLDKDQAQRLEKLAHEMFDVKNKIVILTAGLNLAVLRKGTRHEACRMHQVRKDLAGRYRPGRR